AVRIKGAALLLHRQKSPRVPDGGGHLQPVADDPGIGEEPRHLALVVARHPRRIEAVESRPVVLALAQDGVPAQSRLRPFEDQELKEAPVVVYRHAPLLVVIADGQLVRRPRAAHAPQLRTPYATIELPSL